jgi:hypothetical protein
MELPQVLPGYLERQAESEFGKLDTLPSTNDKIKVRTKSGPAAVEDRDTSEIAF